MALRSIFFAPSTHVAFSSAMLLMGTKEKQGHRTGLVRPRPLCLATRDCYKKVRLFLIKS